MEEFLASFAEQFHVPSEQQRAHLEELFHSLDDDESGYLDFREYLLGLALVAEVQDGSDSLDMIRFAFDALDESGDGLLTQNAIKTMFRRLAPDITQECIEEVFAAAAGGEAGAISFPQFKAFLEAHPAFLKTFQTRFL
uniref:EF-hand domain-containing protein n=1 Tax=Eutreptiella gymnastica TaxID=73025 RepID=A0A7S4L9S6_9EUGL